MHTTWGPPFSRGLYNKKVVEIKNSCVRGLRVIWEQCCRTVAAGPCLPNGPIIQLSPYLIRNPCMSFMEASQSETEDDAVPLQCHLFLRSHASWRISHFASPSISPPKCQHVHFPGNKKLILRMGFHISRQGWMHLSLICRLRPCFDRVGEIWPLIA